MTSEVSIVTALTRHGVIGRGAGMPWQLPEELQYFRQLTQGSTVIMGRRTYESIGALLPDRRNIVISGEPLAAVGVEVCHSVTEALARAQKHRESIFIIGGASVYEQALPHVGTMYLSVIKDDYDGDVFFPQYSQQEWETVEQRDFKSFVAFILKRKHHVEPVPA